MDTSQTVSEPAPARASRRRRWLPYAFLGLLAALGASGYLALGGMSLPAPALPLAIAAGEAEPGRPETPPPAPTPTLLTLSDKDIPVLLSMQERQARLEARAQHLQAREAELQQLQQHIQEQLDRLALLRQEIGALIEEREAFEAKRFEHLVKVYEGMKPAEAASLVERLHEDTAVKLFYRMKEKKVSQILGFVKPEIAARLSERLAVQKQAASRRPPQKEKP